MIKKNKGKEIVLEISSDEFFSKTFYEFAFNIASDAVLSCFIDNKDVIPKMDHAKEQLKSLAAQAAENVFLNICKQLLNSKDPKEIYKKTTSILFENVEKREQQIG